MPRHIRWDELTLKNVLSLVEALLQLLEQPDCESKLPLCVVWEADQLRIKRKILPPAKTEITHISRRGKFCSTFL